jgi:hypothetical protein
MTKPIKTRLEALEGAKRPDPGDHDYKKVITWEANDQIVSRYYKDGEPITASQYNREAPKEPGKVNINWNEYDPEGKHDQND